MNTINKIKIIRKKEERKKERKKEKERKNKVCVLFASNPNYYCNPWIKNI